MSPDTAPIPEFTPQQIAQLRDQLGSPRPHRGRVPAIAALTLVLVLAAGIGGWAAGRAHPRTITRTHTVVRVVTRTKTRTVTKWRTRTTAAAGPGLLQCAEALMGAWETDGQYADVGKLPPSAAQGYNPNVSACRAYPAVWNTPPDQTP